MKLDDALRLFVRRGVGARTAEIDRLRIGPLCDACCHKKIGQITPDDLEAWFARLAGRVGPVTVESHKQTVKTFFNWCVSSPAVALDISPAVFLKPKRRCSARNKAANDADLVKLMACLLDRVGGDGRHPRDVRDLLAVRLAYENGNRLSELTALSTRSMNLALRNPCLSNSGLVIYVAQSGVGKRGIVPVRFSERTAAVYRLWQEIRPSGRSPHRVFIALGGLHSGAPLTKNGFTSIFVRRCREYSLPVVRTHAIRHLKGTKVANEYSPRVAASVLNIQVETAIIHYYDVNDGVVLDAVML